MNFMNILIVFIIVLAVVSSILIIPELIYQTYLYLHNIFNNDQQAWFRNGKLHRENDLPAVIHFDGTQKWYLDGKLHRDNDLPAIMDANGNQAWFQNGELHRDNDLPAIKWARKWFQRIICCCRKKKLSDEVWNINY
jgi:hypothetical protein